MSKQTNKIIPNLRFPEFKNTKGWHIKRFETAFTRVTTKNAENNQNVLTISAQHGLISQLDYFGKAVAAENVSGYYLLHKNEFAYNKSYSKGYPMGAIKPLKNYEKGVVSTLYICFKANLGYCEDFFEHYFDSGTLNTEIEKIAQEGGRNHGLLNVSVKDFFTKVHLIIPTLEEQKKIAACLSSINDLINAQIEKIDGLKAHKIGLMQQVFPPEDGIVPILRFPEFQSAGEWEQKQLKGACQMKAGKFVSASEINENKYDNLYPCYGGNGLRGYTESYTHNGTYSLIGRQGALCGNVMLASGKFHATEHAVVVIPHEGVDTGWLFHMLGYLNLNKYATGQAQPGLSVESLEKVNIIVPKEKKEQEMIANCLSAIDDFIISQQHKLDALKNHKKGLMQQLFPYVKDLSDEQSA